MAQTGYTPILIYSSSTTTNAPSAGSLTNSTLGSELAINITDGKLFYKDNGNNVQVIAWKTTPTTAGGTGLTSYTAGDLLYYASGTALSKLAIGTSGQWLGSSGTAPQWNAPAALTKTDDTNVTLTLGGSASTALLNAASLTLGWTGTLAVSRGGTGTGTAFTAGSVIFAGTSGVYSQDNANLFWDDSNNRLGIGTATPGTILNTSTTSATNELRITTKTSGDVRVGFDLDLAYYNWIDSYRSSGDIVFGTTNTARFRIFGTGGDVGIDNGNLVIGTSGKGIDFSATPGTGTSELFDDYEEGTWTPDQGSGLTVTGTFVSAGAYTKVGRLVTVIANLSATAISCTANGDICTNLPFAAGVSLNAVGSLLTVNADHVVYGTASANTVRPNLAIAASFYVSYEITYMTS
jgi:hypothetical protein